MFNLRLKRARAASGLSMKTLGDSVGVSANMIKKYEHGQSMPSSDVLIKLSKALGVRAEYFFRSNSITLEGVEYRKKSKLPALALKQIEADVLDQAERWEELINLWPNYPIEPFTIPNGLPEKIKSYDEIDKFADTVRKVWDIGLNPIPNLVDEIESRGILVISTNVEGIKHFDGLQATVAGKPIIVSTSTVPGDRQRFTLAHELGHLLLSGRLSKDLDEEKACNYFAAAFLLPSTAIYSILGKNRKMLEMKELYFLKHEYGISMKACLLRSYSLKIITEPLKNRLLKIFSKNKWNTTEPNEPYPVEETILFAQLVYRALGEGIIGESKAAELLGLSTFKFHRDRKLEMHNAAVN